MHVPKTFLVQLHCRGFITLSVSLGLAALHSHHALLQSLESETDLAVMAGSLRALGMLILGSPYDRLPPELLPLCMQVRQGK